MVRQPPRLGDNFFRRTPLLGTTNHGHDAVSAEFVAANLNSNIRLKWRGPHLGIAKGIEALVASFDLFQRSVAASQADLDLLAAAPLNSVN